MSREVSCTLGGAPLCRAGPAFIIAAVQPQIWTELPRRWLGGCSGPPEGSAVLPLWLLQQQQQQGSAHLHGGTLGKNEWHIAPAQADLDVDTEKLIGSYTVGLVSQNN